MAETEAVHDDELEMWLNDTVGLREFGYNKMFRENGYESMKTIRMIASPYELEKIGIRMVGHRELLIEEIRKLIDAPGEDAAALSGSHLNPRQSVSTSNATSIGLFEPFDCEGGYVEQLAMEVAHDVQGHVLDTLRGQKETATSITEGGGDV